MARIRIFQVDAFAERPFTGNPAAVCLLEGEKDAAWMQSVAAEMNLSETAFVRRSDAGLELRWFTPKVEVDLCGHATLAAAHVLWSEDVVPADAAIEFQSRSGALTCTLNQGCIELDFPAMPADAAEPPSGLVEAAGRRTALCRKDAVRLHRAGGFGASARVDRAELSPTRRSENARRHCHGGGERPAIRFRIPFLRAGGWDR